MLIKSIDDTQPTCRFINQLVSLDLIVPVSLKLKAAKRISRLMSDLDSVDDGTLNALC